MATILNAAYSKKLGLPNYSSHSFSASVEIELSDPDRIAAETARLYGILQTSVDNEIRQTGYLPGRNGDRGNGHAGNNGNGSRPHPSVAPDPIPEGSLRTDGWHCSDKQRQLILRLLEETGLDREAVEAMAEERFGGRLSSLNRLQASGIIAELLEVNGRKDRDEGQNGAGP